MLRYAGLAEKLGESERRASSARARAARGITSRCPCSRIDRSNATLRCEDAGALALRKDDRLESDERNGFGPGAVSPFPVTSIGTVLDPFAVPNHGMTTYSSPPPADVMQAPSLMLTSIA